MTLIVDTGGLLSVLEGNQADHAEFLDAVRTHPGPRLLSPLVVAELDHLILDRYGRDQQIAALEEIEAAYHIEAFTNSDLRRARELCSRYADLTSFDLADASCVVLAERHDSFDILSTDQRDFRAIVGSNERTFRILSYDL